MLKVRIVTTFYRLWFNIYLFISFYLFIYLFFYFFRGWGRGLRFFKPIQKSYHYPVSYLVKLVQISSSVIWLLIFCIIKITWKISTTFQLCCSVYEIVSECTVQPRGMRTSKRVPNSFRTHDERVRTKVWTRSRTSSVNAFTAFTFAERICFCLAFLCFGVFYCSRETKRLFGFTMLSGNRDIGLERTDCYVDLDLRRNRKRISLLTSIKH